MEGLGGPWVYTKSLPSGIRSGVGGGAPEGRLKKNKSKCGEEETKE